MLTLLALVVDTLHAHFGSTANDPAHCRGAVIFFWPIGTDPSGRVSQWAGVRAGDCGLAQA